MIKKKLYILIAVILLTLAGTYIFAFITQNRVEKKITDKTVKAINTTIGSGVVQRINYMLEVISKDLAGKSPAQQRIIISNIMKPFKQFGFEGYTQCIMQKNGTPVYLDSTRHTDIRPDIQDSRYREFTTRFQQLQNSGGGYIMYTTSGSILPERFIYVSLIPGTDLWHGIDIDLTKVILSIESVFTPLAEMNDTHRRIMHVITGIVFIFILLITIHITKQITELEKERDVQNRKLKETNTLLEVEVDIRKQIEKDLKEANRELKLISSRDGLTGLANRRYMDEYLNTEWERMAREKKPLSVLLCDVDFFKKYNDAYGHLEGDACLRSIADVLNESCKRPADLAARYGGEEFAVILPDTDPAGARIVAESIRAGVEKLDIAHSESDTGHITISLGISSCIPIYGEKPEKLILAADRALYSAKEAGRNRTAEL